MISSVPNQVEYLTKERYEELQSELARLKEVKIAELAERVAHARSLGDLRENAEYHKAREDQAFLFSRIIELEALMARARVMAARVAGGPVAVGSRVTLRKAGAGEITYLIVSPAEADLLAGKISRESPLGLALMGKAVGESVKILTARGEASYVILKIF